MQEEIVKEQSAPTAGPPAREPVALNRIQTETVSRFSSGLPEVDRVLGGGIVPGSFALLGGDPGIGKSTLLLQIAAFTSQSGPVLYVTAEESASQTRLRAERLQTAGDNLFVLAEGDINRIVQAITARRWRLVVVDSLQTVFNPGLESAPGSVGQVRDVASRLMRVAKGEESQECPIFLVGHVTKEGSLRPVA
jgi:DNA repair protein RadA/Sms